MIVISNIIPFPINENFQSKDNKLLMSMFSNQNSNNKGPFGNSAPTASSQPQTAATGMFGNSSNASSNSLFGGNNPQPAQGGQPTNIFSAGNQPKPGGNPLGGIGAQGGQQTGGTSLFGNAANSGTTPTGTNNMFGNSGQANSSGSIFSNTANTSNQPSGTAHNNQGGTNIFNQGTTGASTGVASNPNTTNPPAPTTAPTSAPSQPQPATGSSAPGTLFSNNSEASGPPLGKSPSNPATTTTAQTPTSGTTNPTAATGATNSLFGMNKPATSTNPLSTNPAHNPPSSQATGGLFANKAATSAPSAGNMFSGQAGQGGQTGQTAQTGQTGQTAQTGQTGQRGGSLFGNPTGGQAGSAGQPVSTGQTGSANVFSNQGVGQGGQGIGPGPTVGTGVVQPQDDIETQFDRSNKTVAEFIAECRSTFLNTYEDLQKMCDSTLNYLNQRQENQKIAKNFAALEPLISNKSDFVMRTLEGMEKQQDEIQRAIEMMSKRLGEGRYTHELSEHIQEYEVMKEEIMRLQEDAGEWNDPGNEQLMNIFQNLNQIETQIKEMDQIAEIYMSSFGYN